MWFRSALRQYQRQYQRDVFSIQYHQWQQRQQGYPLASYPLASYPLAMGDMHVFCGSSCDPYGNYDRVDYDRVDYGSAGYGKVDCGKVDYDRADYGSADYFGTTSQRSQQP